MKPRSLFLRLFPRAWRERYGDEFSALLEDTGISAGTVLDLVFAAVRVRLTGSVGPGARRRLVLGLPLGGDPMLARSFLFLSLAAAVAAAVLFALHSFLYLAVAIVAVLLAASAAAARSMFVEDASGRKPAVGPADLMRTVIVGAAVFTFSVTAVSSDGPSGQQTIPSGLVIDLIAGAAILATAVSWWSDRRRRRTS